MKKLFDRIKILLILSISLPLFLGWYVGSCQQNETKREYAHILLVNTDNSDKNITSLEYGSGGVNLLSSPLQPDDYYHYQEDGTIYGYDFIITAEDASIFTIDNPYIEAGKVLYLEYNGTDLFSVVDDYSKYD